MRTPAPAAASSKAFGIAAWIVQVLLALAFGAVGFMKLTQPIDTLAQNMVWPGDVPATLVRFIGLAELLGAVGLILPVATRIKPGLTPIAAGGLIVVMALASFFHLSRGEAGVVPINLVLGALAAIVLWARTKRVPVGVR